VVAMLRRVNSAPQSARDFRPVAARHGGARGLLVAAVAVALVAAACSRGKSTASPPPTTAPVTTVPQTTTTLDPKQQVIAAYENYVKQYSRVSDDPNGRPDDPILMSTMTRRFSAQIQLNLFGLRNLHRYTKGNEFVTPQQVDIQGTTATLLVCLRDDSDQYDQNGRDMSGHPGVGTPEQVKATLLQSPDGRWLLDQNAPTGKGCSL
jgi:hypothetical protein